MTNRVEKEMKKEYQIQTRPRWNAAAGCWHTSTRACTEGQAILHACKVSRLAADVGKGVIAPRGRKAAVVQLALQYHRWRAERADRQDRLAAPVSARLKARLARKGLNALKSRGLSMPAILASGQEELYVADYRPELRTWLCGAKGFYKYSSRAGRWWQSASYVVGVDEGQLWAARVPGTIGTVAEGLEWLKPAAIREAEQRGLPVVRQGDIFFRPMRLPADDLGALQGTRHNARPRKGGGYTVVHPEHAAVRLSAKYRWRAYASTQLHGRTGD